MVAKEKVNLLNVIPCRSEHIKTEREGPNTILSFPRFRYQWMRRLFLSKGSSPDTHVYLEEHGTAVWELIDGRHTVREIIAELAEHFGEEEYESRITAYILRLQKDGFIKLMADKERIFSKH